ncbi:MAG: alpha/beta fold hydrolase [Desulfobacteraceae bacterium]|nr:alpha/beta fold hydrolase [Desulfobacteraceae bacterium]
MMSGLVPKYKTFGSSEKLTVVLLFGFGMSVNDWDECGYIKLLEERFFLVAIEPFAYQAEIDGNSDLLTLDIISKYIKSVLNTLSQHSALILGYSLGAKLALGFYKQYPNYVKGLIIGGFESSCNIDEKSDVVLNTLKQGGLFWCRLWETMFTVPPGMAQRLKLSDTHALMDLRRAEGLWEDLTEVLEKCKVNCLVYSAESCFCRGQTYFAHNKLNKSEYLLVPNVNHFELITTPKLICEKVISKFSGAKV